MCRDNLLLLGFTFVIAVIQISYICQVFFIILDKSSFLPSSWISVIRVCSMFKSCRV